MRSCVLGGMAAMVGALGCVMPNPAPGAAELRTESRVQIVDLDGAGAPADPWHAEFAAGERSVIVEYATARFDYHCSFRFTAEADEGYFVTAENSEEPRLYRQAPGLVFFVGLRDGVAPLDCTDGPERRRP